jgi:hypothetical protein
MHNPDSLERAISRVSNDHLPQYINRIHTRRIQHRQMAGTHSNTATSDPTSASQSHHPRGQI